ncbi:MAG: ATP-grasp domain-containing protein [Armatimonadota bacterium]|nr:ATP-grasp domain-containing protein [Armatimonadota bacterium]
MNVLITSAGRRVSLLKAFQEAVHPQGVHVFAGDMDPLAPALYTADHALRLPALADPDYIDTVLDLVETHGIDLVVPTIDTELGLLAKFAHRFEERGSRALISSEQMVRTCGDKWLTYKFFSENGICTPRTWLPESLLDQMWLISPGVAAEISRTDSPERSGAPDGLYVKPRNGSASQNTHRASLKSLCSVLDVTPNPVVQENITAPEITIDALLDFKGRPLHYVPRLRLKAIGGESVQGVTIADDDIRDPVVHVLDALGARGPITVQAFLTDDGPAFTEVNPRFGGGFPLTHFAGGRYPEWIVRMLTGERIPQEFGGYRKRVYMMRHNVEQFTEQPLWQ